MFTACSAIIMSCAFPLSLPLYLFLSLVTINNHSAAVAVAAFRQRLRLRLRVRFRLRARELEAHNRCPIQPRNGLVQLSIGQIAVKSENSGRWECEWETGSWWRRVVEANPNNDRKLLHLSAKIAEKSVK